MPNHSQFTTDRSCPGWWTITFNNPPINMFAPTTIVELGALVADLESDPSVKAVVFQSANPDFFIAHLDVSKAAEQPGVLGLWRDFVLRLSSAPVVSIAKIRGRTRGIGNEFVLACDMRFASRQNALFGNPEIGVGLVPGGGALEWLPRLVGRSRALEIVLSGDDFDADIVERYGWVNRTVDDDDLDPFVDTLVRRLASFDRETLAAAKAQLNRFGMPTAAELQSSIDLFFPLLALPNAQARRAKVRGIGYGVRSDFELNFGRYLPAFGPADSVTRPPHSPKEASMKHDTLVRSSFSATIHAPVENVDIPAWCFGLSESEYQSCSPAHVSAGVTKAPDGRRMSINVEVIGGSPMVQHYVEEIAEPHHLRLVSDSDVFAPAGRVKVGVIWDLSVKKIDADTCEFTNTIHTTATPELMDFLGEQGIPLEVFRATRVPLSEAHNRQETPLFAASIERHARRQN